MRRNLSAPPVASALRLALSGLALALLAALPAQAQDAALTVTVVDSATRAPVGGAEVRVAGRGRGRTDAAGVLRVSRLRPGDAVVEVSRLGYVTKRQTVALGGQPAEVRVELAPRPVAVGGVEGQTRRTARQMAIEDFYRRKERGQTGYFVTREDIEREQPRKVTDLFRGLPNIRVDESNGDARMESGRAMAGGGTDCRLLYYVDGMLNTLLTGRSDTIESLMDNINDEFSPEDIEGIEVYLGSNAPARYGGSRGRCGVVLVWTRVPGSGG